MRNCRRLLENMALAVLSLSGCSHDGPAIQARPQTISYDAAPPLALGSSATVNAIASSGLPVAYTSATPAVCSVAKLTGVVTAIAPGTCIIAANQAGNTTYAPAPQATQSLAVAFDPNQTISFAAAPTLSLGGSASVLATASSGLAVAYSSDTPNVCTVNSSTGQVKDLTEGICVVTADQAGDLNYRPAPQATQVLVVSTPAGLTIPGVPTAVTATAGPTPDTISIDVRAIDSGDSPVTSYTVISNPAGLTTTSATLPITIACPATCTGYSLSVIASNALGNSAPSAWVDVVTRYDVVETFFEPDTQPKNTIFVGSFTFDASTSTVSDLHGRLSESMTGDQIAYPNDNMTWLSLGNQLSSVADPTLGGLRVATFLLPTSNTLSTGTGGDGWTPGTGFGLYYGFPGTNPGNAYAMIFVNPANPEAALTQAQIDRLAYADCTPGAMMGSTCMTGTNVAGYGSVGTMSGYPVAQTITKH